MPLEQTCRIMSVSGPVDELTVVAKDIFSLVEEHGYGFQEIGVVARTLTGYDALLPRIFDQHAIPYTSTMARPLERIPIGEYVSSNVGSSRQWVSAGSSNRAGVVTVFPLLISGLAGSKPRQDLWDAASRRFGITKGLDEWRRLTAYLERDLPLRDDDDEDLVGLQIASTHAFGVSGPPSQPWHRRLSRFRKSARGKSIANRCCNCANGGWMPPAARPSR